MLENISLLLRIHGSLLLVRGGTESSFDHLLFSLWLKG